jgi:DNA-binding transcriptional LysR family regulator
MRRADCEIVSLRSINRTMRDLNDLYYFVQVVDHHGFAPAARALGMQKSKLSRRIAALEDQLGTRLIQRSSRKFSVTEIGLAYYQHCLAMLVEAEAAQALIDGARSEPCGTIRVACAPGLLTYQMSGLIVRFMALYPDLDVQLHSTSRRVDVIGEGFDLAIRHTSDGPAERARAKAGTTGTRPSEYTALSAIHPQPCQPEPAPLHAREDDSGDTGRRSSTPSPTDQPWPMASEQCPTPAR